MAHRLWEKKAKDYFRVEEEQYHQEREEERDELIETPSDYGEFGMFDFVVGSNTLPN